MKISTEVLGQQAYKVLKEMILAGRFVPGQKIVQDKLAAELGISRTPLRAALQKLEAEYLLESIPRKGVMVKKFSDDEIIEIYDCRVALEGTAVRLFTEKASAVAIKELTNVFQPFQSGKIDPEAYRVADMTFHNFITGNCGNRYLGKIFQRSNMLVCIHMIGLVRPPEETLSEHIDIIKAIREGNAARAEALMIDHLEKSKQLIMAKLDHEK